ncbi:DUF542 domain-containing protein [Rhizobium sp. 18065]|uniref:DUF542 domain-containing protein n=1 Tax=Rhizobium sp. 18065 TaxID=2681411 RepID=UPI00135CACAC|nr:DUF542 domain-containing protein [Rhizobium sp. 18065]
MTQIELSRTVASVATEVPGAADLFRRHGINFCCGGGSTIESAAGEARIDAGALVGDLETLLCLARRDVPENTVDLIECLLTRYHAVHRSELEWLIPLAQKVERVHGGHTEAPIGLAILLQRIQGDLEEHMRKEELVLFPMMTRSDTVSIVHMVAQMQREHAVEALYVVNLEHLTNGFAPPVGACNSWNVLYAGLKKFVEDLVQHMHLENEVLFPRYTT